MDDEENVDDLVTGFRALPFTDQDTDAGPSQHSTAIVVHKAPDEVEGEPEEYMGALGFSLYEEMQGASLQAQDQERRASTPNKEASGETQLGNEPNNAIVPHSLPTAIDHVDQARVDPLSRNVPTYSFVPYWFLIFFMLYICINKLTVFC